MNDPNRLIQWKGKYHLVYQYNPNGAFWGAMHWGHARSKDRVHWEHLPRALAPTPNSVDEFGVYAGCIVKHDGTPTTIYTGVREVERDGATVRQQLPCIATSGDDLLTWTKYPSNPVIAAPPPRTFGYVRLSRSCGVGKKRRLVSAHWLRHQKSQLDELARGLIGWIGRHARRLRARLPIRSPTHRARHVRAVRRGARREGRSRRRLPSRPSPLALSG